MTPEQAARSCLGTPYHHQGRLPGVGMDCIGLLVYSGKAAGKLPLDLDVTGYPRYPDGKLLIHHLDANLDRVHPDDMRPSDAVCVAYDRFPQHVGILGEYRHGGLSMIHALGSAGKVVEHRLLFTRLMRFVGVYRFRG